MRYHLKITGEVVLAEGNCFGEIIPTERGSGGFGYDRSFIGVEQNNG